MRWLQALLLPFRLFWWAATLQLGRRIQFRRDYRLLAQSGLFDPAFYSRRKADFAEIGNDPLRHYLTQGGSEARDPHPLFDTHWYFKQNPTAAISGTNPLLHYLTRGWKDRSNPHPLFDGDWYLQQNPDVSASGINPLRHYVRQGWREGRNPHLLFDTAFYLERNPDITKAGTEPLSQYVMQGGLEGRDPHPLFDSSFYLKHYPAIAIARVNPLVDFIDYGAVEGRFPNPFFDPSFYLRNNPDVKNTGRNPLVHYLTNGAKEGRDPGPFFSTARYVSKHPDLRASNINPLAHFLGYSNRVSRFSGDSEDAFPAAVTLIPTGVSDCGLPELPNWRNISPYKSIAGLNGAFRSASEAGGHLLILMGSLSPESEVIRRLIESFSLDPHFGAAIPRQCNPLTGEILKLGDENGDPEITALPPQVLNETPTLYILPEILSSCFVLRDSVISNLGCLDETYETIAGALLQYLYRARRCGFRCIVVNNTVVTAASDNGPWLVPVGQRDLIRLHTEYLDFGEAKIQFMNNPLHRHESLLARACSSEERVRQSLLLDARGIPIQVDGTSEAVLGICDGLRQLSSIWAITLWTTGSAAKYHKLSERYPDWEIIEEASDRLFTAALRPSQPWDLNAIIELHRKALFSFYIILDTIAWDILFVAPPGLGTTWNFLSSYADGILYISKYTRDRFVMRFPQAKTTPGYVSYLSLNPRDYKNSIAEGESHIDGEFILVVGNTYDHKNVGPTVDLLTSKLPGQHIKAFGIKAHANPSVACIESGQIRQAELDVLFARAKMVIFPSFYEGFGFPVLQGLSSGRTVIARHSELLYEIAGRYRGPGRLIEFRNPTELLQRIEQVIQGSAVDEVPLGTELNSGEEPSDWKDIAGGILRFIEERVKNIDQCRWHARQMAIEQIEANSA